MPRRDRLLTSTEKLPEVGRTCKVCFWFLFAPAPSIERVRDAAHRVICVLYRAIRADTSASADEMSDASLMMRLRARSSAS